MAIRFIRLPAVMGRRARGRSTTYLDIAEGLFTPGVDLGGGRAKGWPEHEVDAVNAALLAGKSKDDLRVIVAKLVAARPLLAGKSDSQIREFIAELVAGQR